MQTQVTHTELVDLAHRWLLARKCGFAFKELLAGGNSEIPDAIGFKENYSILIECKTSRSDFIQEKKKIFRQFPTQGMGTYRFFLAPKDMVRVEELPENWGLIEEFKGKARVKHNPYSSGGNMWRGGFEKNEDGERRLMYSALRRLHLRNRIEEIDDAKLIERKK